MTSIDTFGTLVLHELKAATVSTAGVTVGGQPVGLFIDALSVNTGSTVAFNVGTVNVAQDNLTISAGTTGNHMNSLTFGSFANGVAHSAALRHGTTGQFDFVDDGAFAPVKVKELHLQATDAANQPTDDDFIITSHNGNMEFQTTADGTFMMFSPPGAGLNAGSASTQIVITRPTLFTSTVTASTPTAARQVATKTYVDVAVAPAGATLQSQLLGAMITPVILDMNKYAADPNVQGSVADGALPLPDANGGWRYCNDVVAFPAIRNPATNTSNKINWYFFNNPLTNGEPTVLGKCLTYSTLHTFYARMRTNKAMSLGSMPFLTLYTVPKKDGTDFATWYRSSKTYIATASPAAGLDAVLYIGNTPSASGFGQESKAAAIPMVVSTVQGYKGPVGQSDIAPTEVLMLMSMGTSSSAASGAIDMTLVEAGHRIGASLTRIITFFQ